MKNHFRSYGLIVSLLLQTTISICYCQAKSKGSNELTDTASINKQIKTIDKIIRTQNEEAKVLSLQVIEASERLNYIQGIVSGNRSLGFTLKKEGKLDSAKRIYKYCIYLIEKNPDVKISNTLYINLANIYSMQSEYDSSILIEKQLREKAIREGDTTNYMIVSNNMAVSYRYLGMWDSGLAVLKENEKIIRLKKDTVRLANCIHLQGTILQGQGNIKAALEHYFDALEIIKPVKDHPLTDLFYQSIITLYLDMEEYRKAIDLLYSIRNSYTEKVQGYTSLYNMLGKAYQGINNFDSAFYYYQKSIDECLALNRPGHAAIAYRFLGDLLNQEERYAEAIDYLQKGLKVCDRKNMKQEYAMTSNSLGTSLLKLKRQNQAEKHFSEAMSIGYELNDIAVLKDATDGLRQVNLIKRNFEAAYYYLEQYKQYSDSLLNAENIRAIATKDLEYNFNIEKTTLMQQQEKERLLHQEILKRQKLIRNTIIAICLFFILISVIIYRSYIIKKKANDEKAALMKEIHHRVKNNLQIISGLLTIQTEYVSDSKVIGAVKESQSRVKAMALIHQLLYQADNLTKVDFSLYLPQLVHVIASTFKKSKEKIEMEVEASGIRFDIDKAIPLGLIITELVSNSFKYAFEDEGSKKISVHLKSQSENNYLLTVADNGKGLPDGSSIENMNSMGLRLVKILTNQLDGRLTYEYNKGAIFTVEFKGYF